MATKWGCVGPGLIARDFFTAIRENLPLDEHQFVAVASRDLSRAQKFADDFKFERAYGCYDDIAKDDQIEVVYISTLNPSHVELSIRMLEAGKHVLCEKPMATTFAGARSVLETARRSSKVFMEGIWSRFFPAFAQIRKELADGTVGDISLVQATFCVPIKGVSRVISPELGGGALIDIGVYAVSFACTVFKDWPESIHATGILSDDKEVDYGACIVLKYKSGAMASLCYHTDVEKGNRAAFIMGNKGTIEVEGPFWCPVKLITPTGSYEYPLKPGNYKYWNSAGLHYEAAAMRETVLSGRLENDICSLADSERIHSIMHEIRVQLGMANT